MNDQISNPYEFSDQAAAGAMPRMKPSGITPIGVIAILLASLGGLFGLMQVASPLWGSFAKGIQQSIIDQAAENPDDPALQMQAKVQEETMAIQDKYSTVNVVFGGVMTISCLALIIAAIMTMSGSPAGRGFFAVMCLVLLLCDLGKTVLTVMQQRESMGIMGDAMQGAFQGIEDGEGEAVGEDVEKFAGATVKAVMIVTVVFSIGWFLLKAFFWIYSWRYLNRQEIKTFYDNSPVTAEAT